MRAPSSWCRSNSGVLSRSVVEAAVKEGLSFRQGARHNAIPESRDVLPCCPLYLRDSPAPSMRGACSFGGWRSEEHTSELQSQSNLVCRLLLEKKKKRFIPTALHAP